MYIIRSPVYILKVLYQLFKAFGDFVSALITGLSDSMKPESEESKDFT